MKKLQSNTPPHPKPSRNSGRIYYIYKVAGSEDRFFDMKLGRNSKPSLHRAAVKETATQIRLIEGRDVFGYRTVLQREDVHLTPNSAIRSYLADKRDTIKILKRRLSKSQSDLAHVERGVLRHNWKDKESREGSR